MSDFPLESWLIGFIAGLNSPQLFGSFGLEGNAPNAPETEPVAYLYNGVRLSKLPEYDDESSPYACIFTKNGVYYFFPGTKVRTVSASGTTSLSACFKHENDTWVPASIALNVTPIWANHDVKYADSVEGVGGTVFLAASDPVPVYE